MTSPLHKALLISILLSLLVFNYIVTSVSASTIESPINRDVSTNVDVVSRGPETLYEYRYGESTILIVVENPNVFFSYRNIHVVPKKDTGTSDIIRKVSEFSPSVVTLYRRLNTIRGRLVANGLSELDIRVEGLVYVANLSGKPIDRIARAIGEVFSDLNVTVVVLDERILGLRRLYVDSGVIELFREIPDSNSDYWRTLNKTYYSLVEDLVNSGCHCFTGAYGIAASLIYDFVYPILLYIDISGNYEKCREIIERHVVELADFIRNYIPEEIPLYVLISEFPSGCKFQLLEEIGNETVQIPSGEQGDPGYETQSWHSLLYIATIVPAPVLGVVSYFMIKRRRK
jgi:hypothetical protein